MIMDKPRETWNERWREKAARPLAPDPWLLKVWPGLPRGRLLDVASGRGRNALFAARKGCEVTAVDISEEALDQLAREAEKRKLDVRVQQVDLEASPRLEANAYDLVLDFFYLQRSLTGPLRAAVRPGGMVVLRTFSSAGPWPGGPSNPEFVLRPGELLEMFAGWEVLVHEEGEEPSSKGGSLAGIVARRPDTDDGE